MIIFLFKSVVCLNKRGIKFFSPFFHERRFKEIEENIQDTRRISPYIFKHLFLPSQTQTIILRANSEISSEYKWTT
jgi:hypothetical protein